MTKYIHTADDMQYPLEDLQLHNTDHSYARTASSRANTNHMMKGTSPSIKHNLKDCCCRKLILKN
jgi:hypothetical protein